MIAGDSLQIKEIADVFGAYIFIRTIDRADCPEGTHIALKSFQIIVLIEGAVMKFVIRITHLLALQFSPF